MTTREYNKQWNNFVRETERGYVSFALGYTRNLEDAKDVVYSVYGKLCQKDYNFNIINFAGMTGIRRALTNRARDTKLQKNATHVMYIEDLAMFQPIDTYSDIETQLELSLLGLEAWEPLISDSKPKKNGANWPYIDRFIGF